MTHWAWYRAGASRCGKSVLTTPTVSRAFWPDQATRCGEAKDCMASPAAAGPAAVAFDAGSLASVDGHFGPASPSGCCCGGSGAAAASTTARVSGTGRPSAAASSTARVSAAASAVVSSTPVDIAVAQNADAKRESRGEVFRQSSSYFTNNTIALRHWAGRRGRNFDAPKP